MNAETKNCQNCKNSFVIEPEDFDFYEKMKVPPPTWCPKCRLQRRLSFLNFNYLYKRQCDLCKKNFISNYHPDAPFTVYCPECWWSDKWDARDYGVDYDFSRPFFAQFHELWKKVPLIGIAIDLAGATNSPYNNYAGNIKDCYLLSQADEVEDSAYGVYVFYSKSLYDTFLAQNCDTCFDSIHIYKMSYGVGLRNQVYESTHCGFLRDCHHCQDCFASANLRNKEYYVFNKAYTKEGYAAELKKWDLGSYRKYEELKALAEDHWKKYPPKTQFDEFSVDCTGNYVHYSKNCKDCFEVTRGEDCRYMHFVRDVKDSYDISMWGEIERCYEGIVGRNAADVKFGLLCAEGAYDTEYSVLTHRGARNNFGCVSMRNDNCILNKQYSKEDYAKLIEKIRKHMNDMPYSDKKGKSYRYGEFFPSELSHHSYNESVANNMFPLVETEARNQGFLWCGQKDVQYKINRDASTLPDHINDATDDLLKEIIGCAQCGKGFKIISQELSFLRRCRLPLPRRCPMCRINKKMNLWMRELKSITGVCNKCEKVLEYPSTLQGQEILCKQCYQAEII